jgi:hypothetical protein
VESPPAGARPGERAAGAGAFPRCAQGPDSSRRSLSATARSSSEPATMSRICPSAE